MVFKGIIQYNPYLKVSNKNILWAVKLDQEKNEKYTAHIKKEEYRGRSDFMSVAMALLCEYDNNPANKIFRAVGPHYLRKRLNLKNGR